jgi:outer membrane protein assembly factor BamB
MSTLAIKDGLLYAADLEGFLNFLDVKTGKPYWKYDLFAAVWGSPMVVDGKVYIGDEDGDMAVLAHGKEEKLLAEMNMGAAIYTTPSPANGVLYIATRNRLFAIAEK